MAYTVESLEPTQINSSPRDINQFDLPVKEFMAYDPKGTMSVTGQPLVKPDPAQPVTNEETPVEPVQPTESVALSPKISALARKEAAARQKELSLKQREKDLEAKLANAEKYEQLKAKIAAKDFSAAEELGMSYEEYTNYLLNKNTDAKPEDDRYRKVEEKLSALEKANEEKIQNEYQANQALWKKEISKVVSENPEFITIKEWGAEAEEAVLKHINDSFDEDDTELTVEQAAKDIEDYLTERTEKISSLTKVKNKFEAAAKVLGPPKTTSTKTITQNMTVTSQKPSTKPFHLMSESEQIAEAYRKVYAAKQQR